MKLLNLVDSFGTSSNILHCNTAYIKLVTDAGFPRWVANSQGEGVNLLFGHLCPVKMTEIGQKLDLYLHSLGSTIWVFLS